MIYYGEVRSESVLRNHQKTFPVRCATDIKSTFQRGLVRAQTSTQSPRELFTPDVLIICMKQFCKKEWCKVPNEHCAGPMKPKVVQPVNITLFEIEAVNECSLIQINGCKSAFKHLN